MADVDIELRFYGMSLFLLSDKNKSASVLLLNSSGMEWPTKAMKEATGGPICHHPILQVEADSLDSSTLPTIPNLVGMVNESDTVLLEKRVGWHLAGLDLTIGSGAVTFTRALPPARHPESYMNGDWTSMGWVPAFNDILPGATLDAGVNSVGALTSSRLVLGGGTLEGERPSDKGFGSSVWSFSPAWQQAMTDSVVFRTTLPDGKIQLTNAKGATFEIKLKPRGTVEMWLSHEAGTRERAIENRLLKGLKKEGAPAQLVHFPAFYHFFKSPTYELQGKIALDGPKSVWAFDPSNPFQDTPVCISGTYVTD
jgi:hypothetical protein